MKKTDLILTIVGLLLIPTAYSQTQTAAIIPDYWLSVLIVLVVLSGLIVVYYKRNIIFKKFPKLNIEEKIRQQISALKANIAKVKEKKYQSKLKSIKERKEALLKIYEEEKEKTEEIKKQKLITSKKERKQKKAKLEEKPAEKIDKVDFLKSIKSIFARKAAEPKVSKESNMDEFSKIKQQFKKFPKDTSSRFKLEIAIARKIVEQNENFCISDVMKKMDKMYQMTGKERIDVYDDIKSLVNGEMCQKVSEKNKVPYYRFV